jgi:DNA-directed RNA polymerase specialized sigma24 family protein
MSRDLRRRSEGGPITSSDAFEDFVVTHELRLRQALTASLGVDRGRDAACDGLAYAWENWDRVRAMENPGGYVYTVARERASRRLRPVRVRFTIAGNPPDPWCEPALPAALAGLPERERVVVFLLHCHAWTMTEVADLLEVSKSTVQTHSDRGLASLRRALGVET